VARLKRLFRDSGATVVWSYAPGFLAPDRMDLGRMEDLTGFRFKVLEKPGPMTIRTTIRTDAQALESTFGVQANRHPRFAVTDEDARVLGRWSDGDEVAFASKRHDGYRSVYAGTAPLPVHILRWLAETARVPLWCDKPDVVTATRGVTCLVATSEGKRTLRFPTPQRMVFDRVSGEKVRQRVLDLKFGDVRMFVDAE
jgi:hypothetical protein